MRWDWLWLVLGVLAVAGGLMLEADWHWGNYEPVGHSDCGHPDR